MNQMFIGTAAGNVPRNFPFFTGGRRPSAMKGKALGTKLGNFKVGKLWNSNKIKGNQPFKSFSTVPCFPLLLVSFFFATKYLVWKLQHRWTHEQGVVSKMAAKSIFIELKRFVQEFVFLFAVFVRLQKCIKGRERERWATLDGVLNLLSVFGREGRWSDTPNENLKSVPFDKKQELGYSHSGEALSTHRR